MENKIVKENIVNLVNQNDLTITGVEKVLAFSPTQIDLITLDKQMQILGQDLITNHLDDTNGELKVSGLVCSIKYYDKREKINLIKRIFK